MAIVIQPEAFIQQGKHESVVYHLPWDAWDADLAKVQREAKFTVDIVRGSHCTVTDLADDRAHRLARVLVRSAESGQCKIIRTITTTGIPPEKRKRSFTILVE